MPSTPPLPSPSDDYIARDGAHLDLAFWNAALQSVGARLRAAEAIRADFDALIATGTEDALAMISSNVGPELTALDTAITTAQAAVAALEDQVAALTGGGGGSISPLIITQDSTHRFVTDTQIADYAARVTTDALNTAISAASSAIIDGAPASLNTLNKLASALGNDPSFLSTLNASIAKKLDFQSFDDTTVTTAAGGADIGTPAFARIVIAGSGATLTSLGNAPSRLRFIRFAGSHTLVHNATSLILPGGANIVTQAGDTAVASSDGSGNWRLRHYSRADGAPVTGGVPIGALVDYTGTVLPALYVWPDGRNLSRTTYAALFAATTIAFTGNTNSTTSLAAVAGNADALSKIAVGMNIEGPGIPAGATVAAYNSGTGVITLSAAATATASGIAARIFPHGNGDGSTTFGVVDVRGRVVAARDNLGGTAANRLTAVSNVVGARLGAAGGSEYVQAHTHSITDPGHNHILSNIGWSGELDGSAGYGLTVTGAYANRVYVTGSASVTVNNATTGITVNTYGSGSSQNVQPTLVLDKILFAGV